MKTKPFICRRWRRLISQALLMALGVLAPLAGALAQQVFVPAPVLPEIELTPPQPAGGDTNRYVSDVGTLPPEVPQQPRQPFQLGPVTLRPHLAYQFFYGNGIQSGPGSEQATAVNGIIPGILLELGSHWTLDYTPVIMIYSDPSFENTVNHAISLNGDTSYYDWTFRLRQDVSITSSPQVQTATQTDQELYTTALGAIYDMNSDMSLELGLKQEIESVSGFTNSVGGSKDWSTMNWLDVHWGPNLGVAGGVGFGYEQVDVGSSMTYEQIQGRVTWRVAHKINLILNGGVEIRQFLDSDASDVVNPIMGLVVEYHPFDYTTLILNGERTVESSFFQDQIVETMRLSANVTQRVLRRFYLGLGGGYARTQSTSSLSGANTRTDDYAFFNVSLSATLFKRGLASIYYSISDNSSTEDGFSFTSNQIGFQLAYRY
jgi:hypothetical protein